MIVKPSTAFTKLGVWGLNNCSPMAKSMTNTPFTELTAGTQCSKVEQHFAESPLIGCGQ